MTPEQILSIKPKVLTQKQREYYFENGYLLLEKFLPDSWIERLRATTNEMVDRSRSVTKSDAVWDLDKGHTAEQPRLRRLSSMNDHHPIFWEYASALHSPLPDAICDLVGPDVKFHHSKLNFKWSKGGDEVKWHQDISFWPHTNYSPAPPARTCTTATPSRARWGSCVAVTMARWWTNTMPRASGLAASSRKTPQPLT